jgi:hypothetical protein
MTSFISGMTIRFAPLIAGGILFTVVSIVSVFVPGLTQRLLVLVSTVLGYLVPGYMLKIVKY